MCPSVIPPRTACMNFNVIAVERNTNTRNASVISPCSSFSSPPPSSHALHDLRAQVVPSDLRCPGSWARQREREARRRRKSERVHVASSAIGARARARPIDQSGFSPPTTSTTSLRSVIPEGAPARDRDPWVH